jgi:hypothetical protein
MSTVELFSLLPKRPKRVAATVVRVRG